MADQSQNEPTVPAERPRKDAASDETSPGDAFAHLHEAISPPGAWNVADGQESRVTSDNITPPTTGVPSRDSLRLGSPPDAPPFLGFPTRIGDYEITAVLGAGGMGTVYLARQDHPRRTVALKVIRPGVRSHEVMRRFERESQILARMRHPGIAQIFAAGTHHEAGPGGEEIDIPYFAMEYIPGAKPITVWADANHLDVRRRIELFMQVCDAVHHGHMRAVVHRDLKPSNVLVDSTGQPKVIDFGVARAIDDDGTTAIHTGGGPATAAGQVVGTLAYMSPEQLRAEPIDLDTRSDVYALGVLLYELLCGRLPYNLSGVPVSEAARMIREDAPQRPSTSAFTTGEGGGRQLRGDIETIILKALEKERARRYQTADELRLDLQRLLSGEPIRARPPTVAYLMRKRVRRVAQRHPLGSMMTIAAVVVAVGVPLGHTLTYSVAAVNDAYAQVLAAVVPPPPGMPSLEHVRIIRVTETTMQRVPELAARFGFDDVTPEEMRSTRRLHGRLMERLAEHGPSVVAWDFTFTLATPYDEDFVKGVNALSHSGIGVAVGVRERVLDEELMDTDISPTILAEPAVRRGHPKITRHALGRDVVLITRQNRNEPIPSLALAAFATAHHPQAVASYFLDVQRQVVEVACHVAVDPDLPHLRRLDGFHEVSISSVVSGRSTEELELDEYAGLYHVILPSKVALAAAAMNYEDVFDATMEELERFARGRAVIVADYRAGRDEHDYRGRPFFGGDIHSAVLESMLAGDAWLVRWERPSFSAAAVGVAAVLGIAVAGFGGSSFRRRVLLVLAILVLLIACAGAYPVLRVVIIPIVPLIVLAITAELCAPVLQWRRAEAISV